MSEIQETAPLVFDSLLLLRIRETLIRVSNQKFYKDLVTRSLQCLIRRVLTTVITAMSQGIPWINAENFIVILLITRTEGLQG